MKQTFFQFNKNYYRKIFGTPMDSSISPILHEKNKYWEIYLTVLDFGTEQVFPNILWVILLQIAHQSKLDSLESSEIFFTTYIHKISLHVFQDFAEKFFFRKYPHMNS